MSGWKKLASAAAASGGGLNVEDVFSTYVYTGTGTTNNITNGIDLAGEGGLVWTKGRSAARANNLWDTERGAYNVLWTDQNLIANESSLSAGLSAFNSNGFTLTGNYYSEANIANTDYVSWTWRKASKFFDIVTYTGNGTSGRTVSHNLGSVPGMIIVKNISNGLSNGTPSYVYHVGAHATTPQNYYLQTQSTAGVSSSSGAWNNTAPTDSVFTVGNVSNVNSNGASYVAYLFANNDGDGNFGPTGDQDAIKCGSYTGNSSNDGPEINLGFEPQWIMIKRASNVSGWYIWDTMRGIVSDGAGDAFLYANASDYEDTTGTFLKVTSTGFKLQNAGLQTNGSSNDYIYIAIRRPMATPESATDVFAMDTYGGTSPNPPEFVSGFPVDLAMYKRTNGTENWNLHSRLIQGKRLRTNTTDAEGSETGAQFDYMNGYYDGTSVLSQYQGWMWKRAPNYFDVVTYTGNGGSQTVDHNLGTTPNMIWIKRRDATEEWLVWHDGVHSTSGETDYLQLHNSNADTAFGVSYMNVGSTGLSFTGGYGPTNTSNGKYIAYLFATLAGVSKVGSYTGNGSTQTIDCGFSSGARFVLIKDYGQSGDWRVWDSERGIVSGTDSFLRLNVSNAAVTTTDWIDPHNSGFTVNGTGGGPNESSANYIFYAIA